VIFLHHGGVHNIADVLGVIMERAVVLVEFGTGEGGGAFIDLDLEIG